MSSISAVGSSIYYPISQQNGIGNDFQSLAKALNSGDLSGAQQAFSTFQKDLQKIGGGNQQDSQSAMQKDVQTLGDALKSGNLADAQKAFAALQQDAQNQVQKGHHHHHHHKVSTDQSTTGTTTASPDSSGTGTSVNLMA